MMGEISFDGRTLGVEPAESVLDALLRHGFDISYSCRSGVCQSCLMRVRRGAVPDAARVGLSEGARSRGAFLACQARGIDSLEITRLDEQDLEGESVLASIVGKRRLAPDVLEIRVAPKSAFEARAGQYLSVVRPDGLSRSYSIASLPDRDGYLELHVRVVPGGAMSTFLANDVEVGSELRVRGPSGACCYVAGDLDRPLLLVGTSTGLAPLLGVIRDAMRHGHRGPIALFHGALDAAGLYGRAELDRLAKEFEPLTVTYSALRGIPAASDVHSDPLPDLVATAFPDLTHHRVYLCGAPDLVTSMRRDAFLRGADFLAIHADAFLDRGTARTG